MPTLSLTPHPQNAEHGSRLPNGILEREIERVGPSPAEIDAALAFVAEHPRFNARAYDALAPRMRRLVDLVAVAGPMSSVAGAQLGLVATPGRASAAPPPCEARA